MKQTSPQFKYSVRKSRPNETKSKADSLVKQFISKDAVQFWEEISLQLYFGNLGRDSRITAYMRYTQTPTFYELVRKTEYRLYW